MKKFLVMSALSFSVMMTMTSCNNDDGGTVIVEKDNSITGIAEQNADLSTLVDALERTGLDDVLRNNGSYTVFAPTNAAFQALLDSNPNWNSLDDIDTNVLKLVLLYHVLDSKVTSSDLSTTYVNTLAQGYNNEYLSLFVSTDNGVKFDGDANPVTVDVMADNGIVHVIDKVMLPNSIVEFALENPNFSTLVAALTDSRHTTDFVSVLSGQGPFTVFAPTNDAFQALLDSNNDWNGLGDIPIEVIDAVLKYHVVSGANVQSDQLSDDMTITTLGGDLMTDLSSGAKLETSSNQSVDIILTDVQGTNGVIHAINQVLLP